MKRRGASGASFETIVASGPRSAWAHARPTSKLLRKNELVVLDQGAILRGYCSDMTRTVFLGRASERVRAAVPRRLGRPASGAKPPSGPGVTAGEVDAAARDTLKKHGLDQLLHTQHRPWSGHWKCTKCPGWGKARKRFCRKAW